MTWKLPALGLAGSAGLYLINHRVGAAMLLLTMAGVFLAAVFGSTR